MNRRSPALVVLLAAGLLAGWIFFLRAPSFGATLWNVDEGIHAAVAATLRHGGVLYRDAIDQRTPLSYHAFAAVFGLAGDFNLPAVRAFVAALIAATGLGVFLLGRRAGGPVAGALAALLFAAFSTNLLVPPDAFAAHTEWFAIFFTTWGAWSFWRATDRPAPWRAAAAGACWAGAFLSKQPALLELGAPLGLVACFALRRAWTARTALVVGGGLLAGWLAVVGVTATWFAAHGALGDAVYYAWTYNVTLYGPDVPLPARIAHAFMPVHVLAREYPLALAALVAAGGVALVRVVQLRPTERETQRQPWLLFVVGWTALAFAGAASGGRGFEHYAIQCLPAFALLAGTGVAAWLPSGLADWNSNGRRARAVLAGLFAAAVALEALVHPLAARAVKLPPPDPATPIADYIRARTTPDETIFVWGYNPDIHLYAQRRAASRFVYASFLTGLIPWTNLAPEKDTTYAIVPGAMDTLLRELNERRPAFVVDCTPGPHRHFEKYPLAKFPALERFVAERYVPVETAQFVPRGFRVWLIRDSFRRTPPTVDAKSPAAATPPADAPPPPSGPENADLRATDFTVFAERGAADLRRLELLVDGTVLDGVSFAPAARASATFAVPFGNFPAGRHELVVRATYGGGISAVSAPHVVQSGNFAVPVTEQERFSLPYVATALRPLTVQAPYGPAVHVADGRRQFAVHAPSVLAFELDGRARRVSGTYGINAGAYAPENKSPTDGAGFRITLIAPDGARTVLLQRLLRPAQNDWERGEQNFSVELPAHAPGSRLEFATDNGPHGNGACDWTQWTDLRLDATAP